MRPRNVQKFDQDHTRSGHHSKRFLPLPRMRTAMLLSFIIFSFADFFPFILSFPYIFLFPELTYGSVSQENGCIIDRKMTIFKKIIRCIFFHKYICSKGI